jgi:hypothetical protein
MGMIKFDSRDAAFQAARGATANVGSSGYGAQDLRATGHEVEGGFAAVRHTAHNTPNGWCNHLSVLTDDGWQDAASVFNAETITTLKQFLRF